MEFFRVPKNQDILSWNASQQNPNTNQPKHTFWEKFLATLEISKLLIIPLINQQNQPLDRNYASLSTLHNEFSCISIWDRNLKNNLPQSPWNWKPKTTLLICTTTHPSTIASRDFHQAHFTWQLPCHTIIMRSTTTHTYQTKENDTNLSMLSNITTSPFGDPPCLHTIESKHSQPPTKKTCFLPKP